MQAILARTAEILMVGWGASRSRKRALAAAVNHAIDFHTWRSLAEGTQITRAEAVELVAAMVESAAGATLGSHGSRDGGGPNGTR